MMAGRRHATAVPLLTIRQAREALGPDHPKAFNQMASMSLGRSRPVVGTLVGEGGVFILH